VTLSQKYASNRFMPTTSAERHPPNSIDQTKADSVAATKKLRRLASGAARPAGHDYQDQGVRILRKNPARIQILESDPSLSGCGGLVEFGQYTRERGVEESLAQLFGGMKSGARVVYPMQDVIRTLIDAQVAGESRIFGIERLSADPLFRELSGGDVPSVDVLYKDLARFDDETIKSLEDLMAEEGLAMLREAQPREIHVDIDTTVEVQYSEQREGAVKGYNPRYRGRPSFHPMLARIPEIGSLCVGAVLRPGNTTFGKDDLPTIRAWLVRIKNAAGPNCRVTVRMDSAGDFTGLMQVTMEEQVYFVGKAKLTPNLRAAVTLVSDDAWKTTVEGVDKEALEQAAEVPFVRQEWGTLPLPVRVIAVRSKERQAGGSDYLWDDLEYSARVYLTSDPNKLLDEVAFEYDGRAEIEPYIGEQKNAWGLGHAPSGVFHANHAMFLIKLYASNLLTGYGRWKLSSTHHWATEWTRKVLILVPARIIRGARQFRIRLATAFDPAATIGKAAPLTAAAVT
jgi:hypothetical protein